MLTNDRCTRNLSSVVPMVSSHLGVDPRRKMNEGKVLSSSTCDPQQRERKKDLSHPRIVSAIDVAQDALTRDVT